MQGSRVLVTGAAGFIGSHLVEELCAAGANVKAFVRYNSASNWGWLESLPATMLKDIEVIAGDIRDQRQVREAVKHCDQVFHLAALIAIPYSYQAPDSYISTNIGGTYNVLESARESSCSRVVITSTSEVYGTALRAPIEESHPRQAQSPYSASKIGADALADSYFRSFNLPLVTVRPFNTFGPRQSARAIIPTLITQLLSGQSEIRVGAMTPTRDLLYVKDTVRGFLAAAQSQELIGQEVNLCTQSEISIGELGRMLIDVINPSAKLVCDQDRMRPEKSEVNRLLGSHEKIRSLTGWKPQYDLKQGLEQTIGWFRENLGRYKVSRYNV